MQGLVHQNKDFELLFWGFPGGLNGKKSDSNAGDLSLIPGLGRSPGEGNGNLLQYSCLEDSMDKGAWQGYSPQGCKESDTTEGLTIWVSWG